MNLPETNLSQPAGKEADLHVDVKIETDLRKRELVILWMFVAVLAILTVVAGYLFWKKVSPIF